MLKIKAGIIAAFILGVLMAVPTGQAAEVLAVGTGSKGSNYYPLGRAICKLINRNIKDLSCEILTAEGGDVPESIANLINVKNEAVEIGVTRSDWQHFVMTKSGPGPFRFMHTHFDNLRTLFSVYSEPLTILARQDADIQSLDDLKGKRINIGRFNSDSRLAMEMVMAAKGWTTEDFALVGQLPVGQQSLSFCHNRVQAIVFMNSHPDSSIEQTMRLCRATMINVSGSEIEKLVAEKPYLTLATIPPELYTGMTAQVETFGVAVTVVSSSDVSDDIIYTFVKGVFEHLPEFKKMHPALRYIDPERMAKDGLSAPLHSGAERYFRERGLL